MGEWGIGFGSKVEKATRVIDLKDAGAIKEVSAAVDKETFGEWVLSGVKVVASFLIENNEIFVIVAIVGMYFVIVGKRELGTKITSGSIIAYIVAKAVEGLC